MSWPLLITTCRFISDGTWFDVNTEVYCIDDYRPGYDAGLFTGYHNGELDEELCPWDEFLVLGSHSE